MLEHKALYFPVLAALNDKDKLEGAAPRIPPNATPLEKKDAWYQWSYNRCVTFVNCWHMAEDECAAMWSLYGNQGVAIQTTYGLLVKAIDQGSKTDPPDLERRIFGGKVIYIDPDAEAPPETCWNAVNDALKKRRWYEYEKEVRLIYELSSNYLPAAAGSSELPGTPKQKGVSVSCSLEVAVRAIVVAPHSPTFLQEAIRAICDKFGLKSSLLKRSRIEEGAPVPPAISELADYFKGPPPLKVSTPPEEESVWSFMK